MIEQYPLALPVEAQNNIDLTGSVPTPRRAGFAMSALDTLNSLPTDYLARKTEDLLTKEFSPGELLSPKEYKEGPYAIPGVDHPEGIVKNLAKLQHSRWVNKNEKETLYANMPDDLLSKASIVAGSTVGFLTLGNIDIPTLATAKLATSLTSRLIPWVLSKVEGTLPSIATKVAGGTFEGAAISTPLALAQYQNNRDLGEDAGALSVLTNIGLGAGLGVAIRLGFGYGKYPIAPVEHTRAQEVAVSHLAEGKAAHVEPVIKNAAYQMSKESEPFVLKAENMVRDLEPELEKREVELNEAKTKLGKILKEKVAESELEEFKTGEEVLKEFEEIRSKPEEILHESEASVLKRYTSKTLLEKEPTILKKAFQISEKHPVRRTPEEEQFLKDFSGKKEAEIIQSEIDGLTEKRDTISDKLNETKSRTLKTKLRFKLSDIDNRIENNKKRLGNVKALKRLQKDDIETFNARKEVRKLEKQRNALKEIVESNRIYAKAMTVNSEPLAKSDLRSSMDWVNDWRSDFSYSEKQARNFDEELSKFTDDTNVDFEEPLEAVKDLQKEGLLNDEEEEFLDSFEKEDSVFKSGSKALRTYAKCLIGFGES